MCYNGIVKMVQLKWLQLNGLLKNGLFPNGRGLPIFDFKAQNMEKIRGFWRNTQEFYEVEPGTPLVSVMGTAGKKALAAYVDNQLKELGYRLYMDHSIEFLDYSNPDGIRCYKRSLFFILQKAIRELYPKKQLILDYTLPNGNYGELVDAPVSDNPDDIFKIRTETEEDIARIKQKMQEIVDADIPIVKKKMVCSEAVAIFQANRQFDKANLFRNLGRFFVPVYFIGECADTFYGPMVYSTKDIRKFNIQTSKFCSMSISV